eukprot:m.80731 g.80731  ORF g.80731 m.80731 type:complete len:553 (+) comp8633_c0_seq1:75-1733(+)
MDRFSFAAIGVKVEEMTSLFKASFNMVFGAAKEFHQDLHDSFRANPVMTAIKLGGAVILTKVVIDVTRYLVHNWYIGAALSGQPTPPGRVPFFGHAFKLMVDAPWDVIENWIQGFNYQPMAFKYMGKTGIVIGDLDRVRKVFNTKQRNYVKDLDMSYKPFLDILGNGLVTSSGELWSHQRTLLGHALRVEILEETMNVAKKAADRLSKIIQKYVDEDKPINIQMEFHILTLQVIGELILSLTPEESKRVFPDLYLPIVEEANKRVWAPWRNLMFWTKEQREYRKTVDRLNTYLCELIRSRWEERKNRTIQPNIEDTDVLDRVLDDVDPSTWSESIVLQLRDEVKTFILAGHETSASMMTWIMFQLSTNPDVKKKLLDETSHILGTGRGSGSTPAEQFDNYVLPDHAELNKLNYTLNALKETLRLYSLVPVVTRIAVEDDDLCGVKVRAGTGIFIHIGAVHHNPEVWSEPRKFQPERFFEKFDPCAFLPFIVGPRNCLGQNLALLEARVVIALLWLRFDFTAVDGNDGERDKKTVPIMPKNGMWLKVSACETV